MFLREHYQFMEAIAETRSKTIKLNTDVLGHVLKSFEKEIRERFGAETVEILNEKKEEFIFEKEMAEKFEEYMQQFTVKKIQFCKKILYTCREELELMITTLNKNNITIAIEEKVPQFKLVGREDKIRKRNLRTA